MTNNYKTLRLILGDQLNASHSWYRDKDSSVLYVIAEQYQEASYVKHHIQKIAAFFLAMQAFAAALESAGHNVRHLELDDSAAFADLPELITELCKQYGVSHFEYQRPDEYRLWKQLEELDLEALNIGKAYVETEHFIVPFDELSRYFTAGKGTRLEGFYRKMRKA
ncbi:MAG: deoxyribodipyrimidine photolyase-related protein, partial [Arenicella sp.]